MAVELCITSNFTFLTGASHPEEYVARAADLGLSAIAITDDNSVAGIVRAHTQARTIARDVTARAAHVATHGETGPPCPAALSHRPAPILSCAPRLIPGTRLILSDGLTVTVLPSDRAAWGRLCRLLSMGKRAAPKGDCHLSLDDLLAHGDGQRFLLHPPQAQGPQPGARAWLTQAQRLTRRYRDNCCVVLSPAYDGLDGDRFAAQTALAEALGLPTIAAAAPLMHAGRRRRLADVLSAIRTGKRIDQIGRTAQANAEQRLRSGPELARIFAADPDALSRAEAVAAACTFSLDELRYQYPTEAKGGETADQRLARLAHDGLAWRYPAGGGGGR